MFGFACDETKEYMPFADLHRAPHRRSVSAMRATRGQLPFLRPDGKCQVTVEYKDDSPARRHGRRLDAARADDVDARDAQGSRHRRGREERASRRSSSTRTRCTTSTRRAASSIGGPKGDCGLTGRKIIVDTYGGMGRHGGGAFSGKDPARSTAAPRTWRATSRRTSSPPSCAKRCEVQVAYAIGVAEPVSRARRHLRHRRAARRAHREAGARGLRPEAGVDHQDTRPEEPDLPANRVLRALRTPVRRAVLHLGAHRPRKRLRSSVDPRPLSRADHPDASVGRSVDQTSAVRHRRSRRGKLGRVLNHAGAPLEPSPTRASTNLRWPRTVQVSPMLPVASVTYVPGLYRVLSPQVPTLGYSGPEGLPRRLCRPRHGVGTFDRAALSRSVPTRDMVSGRC